MKVFYSKSKYKLSLTLIIVLLLQMVIPMSLHYSFANEAEDLMSTSHNNLTVAEDVYSEPKEFQFITSVELTDEDGNPLGEDVRKNSEVRITYHFEIPDDVGVNEGDTYELSIPDEIEIVSPLEIPLDGEDGLIATANIDTNNNVVISFTEYASTLSSISGYFYVYTEFDEKEIGNDGETKIEFDLGGESSQSITVDFEKEPETSAVNLVKSGKYDVQNNEITWEIVVTPETTPDRRPINNVVITDVIEEGQNYIDNSAEITPNVSTGKFAWDEAGKKLTYAFNEEINTAPDEKYIITFKTKPNISMFDYEGQRIYFRNQAEATYEDDGKSFSNEAQVNTTVDFVRKNGKYDNAKKQIDWTITINNNHMNISNAEIVDNIPDGLELDQDTIELDGNSIGVTVGGPLTYVGNVLTYSFSEEISTSHTLTFSTKVVDADAYNSNTPKEYENHVKLTGNGVPGNATDEKGVKVPTSIIRKEGAGYDRSTHQITWKIIVNSNKIKIENAKVSDDIPKGLKYVEGSFTVDKDLDISKFAYNAADENDSEKTGSFTYNFPEEISDTYTITFKTEVLDNTIYANNTSKTFYNTAKLSGGNIPESASQGQQYVYSQVIEKTGTNYDYLTREATWTIVVNQNKMPMKNAYIIDEIGEYQEFVPNSVTINGKSAMQGDLEEKNSYSFDEDTKTLRYDFKEEINDTQIITFKTKINDLSIFNTNGDKKIHNTAELIGYDIRPNVKSDGEVTIENTVVGKTGKYTNRNSYIDWEVVVNQNQLTIENATLEDTLQEGLELDTSSVKLFKLIVSDNGTLTEGEEVLLDESNVKYNIEARKFEFYFNESIEESYILKFRTDIDAEYKDSTFNNTINFKGSGLDQQGKSEKVKVSFQTGGGGAVGSNGSITVIKVDEENNMLKLKGATFELLDKFKNILEDSSETGEDGQIVFDKLKFNTTYYIREKTSPIGYVLSNELYKFTLENEEGLKDITYSFENSKIRGNIEFTKTGEKEEPIEGAEFTLYAIDDEEFESPIATAISNEQGEVIFKDIEYGRYKIVETKAPVGYNLTKEALEAIIEEYGVTVKATPESVSNTKIKGSLKLTKTDMSESNFLPNAKIAVYTEEGILIEEKITDENGVVKFEGLEFGKYYFKEIKAPKGYVINKEKHTFEIAENEEIVERILKNKKKTTPSNPDNPKDPDDSDDPDDPEDPEDPKEPENPGSSEEPEEPKDPEDPENPEDSEYPQKPNNPIEEITPKETPKDGELEVPKDSTPEVGEPPENGTVTIDENGKWTYTPNPGFVGEDRFTIKIIHPDGTEEETIIEIDVEDTPHGAPDVLPKTGEDSRLGFYFTGLILMLTGLFIRRKTA